MIAADGETNQRKLASINQAEIAKNLKKSRRNPKKSVQPEVAADGACL
jgi:hypothetical protein